MYHNLHRKQYLFMKNFRTPLRFYSWCSTRGAHGNLAQSCSAHVVRPGFTVKPLTFRMEKSANYPYHLLRMIYSFYIYAGTASFGGSHPNAFNFFKYAWIFRSALN